MVQTLQAKVDADFRSELFLPEMKGTQKLAATGRDKINMSFTTHHPPQKDNNLMSSMCQVDGTTSK